MSLIEEGIKQKLIRLSEDGKWVEFLKQDIKPRDYTKPEMQVQVEAYLKLILVYGYDECRIRQFVPVTMGSTKKEADIIVYEDDFCFNPSIVVECKKQDVSEAEFLQAIEQAASYAYALSGTVKYIWATSGIKDSYLQIDKERQTRIIIPNIPLFGKPVTKYTYVKGGRLSN